MVDGALLLLDGGTPAEPTETRVTDGLVVDWDMVPGADPTLVYDVSGVGAALNLTIQDPGAVEWRPEGLEVQSAVRIDAVAAEIITALQATDEGTFEWFVTPANITQDGPARIMSIANLVSPSTSRNFMLGQGKWNSLAYQEVHVRCRTVGTDNDGRPELVAPEPAISVAQTHIVYTLDAAGNETLWINGVIAASGTRTGGFSNWDADAIITLANEATGSDRPWLGTLHRTTVYDRALTPAEVDLHYSLGPKGDGSVPPPLVEFVESSSAATEDGGQLSIPFTVSRTITEPTEVPVSLSGDAPYGELYTLPTRRIVVPAGSTAGSVLVDPVDDSLQPVGANPKTIGLRLALPGTLARRNQLNYTRNFLAAPWSALDVAISFPGIVNPDGSQMPLLAQAGQPAFVPYLTQVALGTVGVDQTWSGVIVAGGAEYCRASIVTVENGSEEWVSFRWVGGVPQVHATSSPLITGDVLLGDPDTDPPLGRFRVSISRQGQSGIDLGMTREVRFYPVSEEEGDAAAREGKGTHLWMPQLEDAPVASLYQLVMEEEALVPDLLAGAGTTHDIALTDDDVPLSVLFALASSTTIQAAAQHEIGLTLNQLHTADVVATVEIDPASTAQLGVHFNLPESQVTIDQGLLTANLIVAPIDVEDEENREVIFNIVPGGAAEVGVIAQHTLAILGSEVYVKPATWNSGPNSAIYQDEYGPTQALTPIGSLTIDDAWIAANGPVLENFEMTGMLTVRAINSLLIIRNFRINSSAQYCIKVHDDNYLKPEHPDYIGAAAQLTEDIIIEHGELIGGTSACAWAGDYALASRRTIFRHVNANNWPADGFKFKKNVRLEKSMVHESTAVAPAHADGVQIEASARGNIEIDGCFMHQPSSWPTASNACILIQLSNGGSHNIDNISITNNWLEGGNYTVYWGIKSINTGLFTNQLLANNRFGLDYNFGPIRAVGSHFEAPGLTRFGNVYDYSYDSPPTTSPPTVPNPSASGAVAGELIPGG